MEDTYSFKQACKALKLKDPYYLSRLVNEGIITRYLTEAYRIRIPAQEIEALMDLDLAALIGERGRAAYHRELSQLVLNQISNSVDPDMGQ
jgi:hypothetical protein